MTLGATITDAQKARFVRLLRESGNIGYAASACGLRREALREQRKVDEDFDRLWTDAELDAADALEREARRRAVEGVRKPVWYKGGIAGHEQVYSDSLLIRLLEANKPDKFANRSKSEVTSPDGSVPLAVTEIAATITSLMAMAASRMAQEEIENG